MRYKSITKKETQTEVLFMMIIMILYVLTGDVSLIFLIVYHYFSRLYRVSILRPLRIISHFLDTLFLYEKRNITENKKAFSVHICLSVLMGILLLNLYGYQTVSLVIFLLFAGVGVYQIITEQCLICKFYTFLNTKNIDIKPF